MCTVSGFLGLLQCGVNSMVVEAASTFVGLMSIDKNKGRYENRKQIEGLINGY